MQPFFLEINTIFVRLRLMKKLALFLFLVVLVFFGSFAAARFLHLEVVLEKQNQERFHPASYALKNRPFTIVVVGYNNGAYVEKTISSIFSQTYENFRLIYIDDASDDGSFDVARDCIYNSDYLTHVTFVRNEEHLGMLANVYRAVAACPDQEIIVLVNGEDWLAHEWVLQRLNAYYDDPNLWISLAQGIDYPSYELSSSPNVFRIREKIEGGSHLKSFYAALFKQIRESDFMYAGSFLPACDELAYMTPMLEMGKEHYHFIQEVLSVSNKEVIRQEDREVVEQCEKFILSLESYSPLTALQVHLCGD